MIRGLLGRKIGQSQQFSEDGRYTTVTLIKAGPCYVTQIKSNEKDGYNAIQLGFDNTKNTSKPRKGIFKKAGLKTTPRFLREFKTNGKVKDDSEKSNKESSVVSKLKLGQEITVDKVFQVGDKVKVCGVGKGKGFAGVVKRWGFKGGPRTHGQSDRERAAGSIGQGTTPGRVHKGKKMPGRMGGRRATVSGLKVLEIDKDKNMMIVAGLVPGVRGGLVEIYKH